MAVRIATLTMNPSVDVACEAALVRPVHKVRTYNQRHDAGGGGINVARVLRELGIDACSVILSGGMTGQFLEELLSGSGLRYQAVPVAGVTRVAHTVLDHQTGLEYRFVPDGAPISEAECAAALAAVEELEADWLIASGSLPRDTPPDFYAQIAAITRRRGIRLVLDTSGPALKAALGTGLTLVKPSLNELEQLVGHSLPSPEEQEAAAQSLVQDGAMEMLAITLGGDGALLATAEGVIRKPAIPVEVRSTVGAGDSFVAGITAALSRGAEATEALNWGLAAGGAAVTQPGTARPRRADIEALFQQATAQAN